MQPLITQLPEVGTGKSRSPNQTPCSEVWTQETMQLRTVCINACKYMHIHNIREFWGQNFDRHTAQTWYFFVIFYLFVKKVKSHVFLKSGKNIKYVFSNTGLRQVNGRDNVFIQCLSVCLSVRLCAADRLIKPVDNFFKTAKAVDCKFSVHVPRDSPNMTPLQVFKKGGMVSVMWPQHFWSFNANSSKTVTAAEFVTDADFPGPRVRADSFQRGTAVTWPLDFWVLNANSCKTDFKFGTRGQSEHDSLFFVIYWQSQKYV